MENSTTILFGLPGVARGSRRSRRRRTSGRRDHAAGQHCRAWAGVPADQRQQAVGGSVEAEEQQRQSGEEDGLIQPCGQLGNLVISEKHM
jgi:hypothetical protein